MTELLDVFFILLATIGPFKVSIIFAQKTADLQPALRRRIAIKTVLVATVVALLFVFAGRVLMDFFHFSVPALTIAGGLILLVFAVRMVLTEGHELPTEMYTEKSAMEMAVYPLAVPLMASPLGIVVLTLLSTKAFLTGASLVGIVILVLAVMLINLAMLLLESHLLKYLDPGWFLVAERVLGILLAALAVQALLTGLWELGVLEALPH